MSGQFIEGCGHFDSSNGLCLLMFNGDASMPSLAKEALIDPPGALEGPPPRQMVGWLCGANHRRSEQINCNAHVPRRPEQDEEDYNL